MQRERKTGRKVSDTKATCCALVVQRNGNYSAKIQHLALFYGTRLEHVILFSMYYL